MPPKGGRECAALVRNAAEYRESRFSAAAAIPVAAGYSLHPSGSTPIGTVNGALFMCVHHNYVSSFAILLPLPTGGRLIAMPHSHFLHRRTSLQDFRGERAA